MMTFAPSSTSGVTTEAHAMDSRRIGQWPLVEGQTAERPVGGRLVTRIGTCVPDRSGLIPVLTGDELSDQATDGCGELFARGAGDRKSTRLNSSHSSISYAVFCLKK